MACYYEIIAGSRCYGLNIETSDIDLCRVSDSWNITGHNGEYHLIQVPRIEFAERAILLRENPIYIQWLFPYKVLKPGMIWEFLLEQRENIVSAAKKRIWDLHTHAANCMSLYPEHYYDRVPKRLAYSTLFYNILTRYASGVPFSQAIRPEKEMQQILLAIRQKELPLNEVIMLNQEAKKKLENVALFYDQDPDISFLKQTELDIKNILEI